MLKTIDAKCVITTASEFPHYLDVILQTGFVFLDATLIGLVTNVIHHVM